MKKMLYLVLKGPEKAFSTLEELRSKGFNATVVNTESLRHAVEYYPGERHFINLRSLSEKDAVESILCLFLLEKEEIDAIKEIVREHTDSFRDIHGFMYTVDINDFEGSF